MAAIEAVVTMDQPLPTSKPNGSRPSLTSGRKSMRGARSYDYWFGLLARRLLGREASYWLTLNSRGRKS